MESTDPSAAATTFRRDVFLMGLLLSLVTGVLLDMLIPGGRGRLFGLAWAVVCMAFIVSAFGGVKMSSARRALASGVTMLLLPCVLAGAFAPNLQRMFVQIRVEGLGGTVDTSFDTAYGDWFPYEDVYLPRVCHESLGEAFFGRLMTVRLDGLRLHSEQIRQLHLPRPLDGLSLAGAQLTPEDLARTIAMVDVRSLNLSTLSVTERQLMECGKIPSLEWLIVRWTAIDDETAARFAERFPHVTIVYGRGPMRVRKSTSVLR